MTDDIPKVGDALTIEDFDMIVGAVSKRRSNFPEEPAVMSLAVILFNIGDRFAPVNCTKGEWSGLKSDVPHTDGIPKCPNGHVLMQGYGLRLGWVADE